MRSEAFEKLQQLELANEANNEAQLLQQNRGRHFWPIRDRRGLDEIPDEGRLFRYGEQVATWVRFTALAHSEPHFTFEDGEIEIEFRSYIKRKYPREHALALTFITENVIDLTDNGDN